MHTSSKPESGTAHSYVHTPTRTVEVNGSRFAYRQLGPDSGTPVILLNHLGGNLDNWDPRVVDGLAAHHRVITFDNRGVGASEGSTPTTIAAMARDAVSFVRALGFDRVDLVGFSLGGFITQVLARDEPQLVRRIVLAGTGPAGGEGIDKVTSITIKDMIRAALTFSDPKRYLFFTRTANGQQAARDFLARLKERTEGRDAAISPWTFRAQLKAIHAWGRQQPADLSGIVAPALVVNGDADRMVPSSNTLDLARRLPNSELEQYPDAGHGGAFQYHDAFVTRVRQFLERD
jgi:pimeloyl-ACP methyl ester carboxylesterase